MSFQIHALSEKPFEPLFDLNDAELRAQKAKRMTVTAKPGFPCRVTLKDAEIGETVLLVNHNYLAEDSPYHGRHAVFVRPGFKQAFLQPGEMPPYLSTRLLSVRGFDQDHLMQAADVVDGQDLERAISGMFENPDIDYLHIHNAKPGCYAARVTRA